MSLVIVWAVLVTTVSEVDGFEARATDAHTATSAVAPLSFGSAAVGLTFSAVNQSSQSLGRSPSAEVASVTPTSFIWRVVGRVSDGAVPSRPSISGDGRFVAFESQVGGAAGPDIFVRDRQAGTTETISVAFDGGQANGRSAFPAMSADGRFVAFVSFASNLVPEDTNDFADVFVRDRTTQATERVSVASDGTQANTNAQHGQFPGAVGPPALSADGRYIAFQSTATNLAVPADTNSFADVFLRDRVLRRTETIASLDGMSTDPVISGDGSVVAYGFTRVIVVTGFSASCIHALDRSSRARELISIETCDRLLDRAGEPSISADGRFVAYTSINVNPISGATPGDVLVFDRQSRVRRGVAGSCSGAPFCVAAGSSLSADARFVAFTFQSSGDDVFVRDLETGALELVSRTLDSGPSRQSSGAAVSADGRALAFASIASNLLAGDTNQLPDIFVAVQAQRSSIDDDFNDNFLNPRLWQPYVLPSPAAGAVSETNQRLEVTLSEGRANVGVGGLCKVSGDFDVQVDFVLLSWSPQNGQALTFLALDLGSSESGLIGIGRHSAGGESYFMNAPNGRTVPASGTSGTFRLVRVSSTMSAFYDDGAGFVLLDSVVVDTIPTGFVLNGGAFNPSATNAALAFDNFAVNAGSVQCATVRPDVSVTVGARPDRVASGDEVIYEVIVRNVGSLVAQDVVLGTTLPSGFAPVVKLLASQGSCSDTTPSDLKCEFGAIGPGQSATLIVTSRTPFVRDVARGCTFVSVTASDDINATNDRSSACTEVWPLYVATGDSYPAGGDLDLSRPRRDGFESDPDKAYPARVCAQLNRVRSYMCENISKSGTTAASYPAQLTRPELAVSRVWNPSQQLWEPMQEPRRSLLQGPGRPAVITITIGANEMLQVIVEQLTEGTSSTEPRCRNLLKLPRLSEATRLALVAACISAVVGSTGKIYAQSVKGSLLEALGALSVSPFTRDSLLVVTTYPNPCPTRPQRIVWQICELLMSRFVNAPVAEAVTEFQQSNPEAGLRLLFVDRVPGHFSGHEIDSAQPWFVDISGQLGLPIRFGVHPNKIGQQCLSNLVWQAVGRRLGATEPIIEDPCPDDLAG